MSIVTEEFFAQPQRRPATADEAKALANPLRLRILRLCLERARTNKELGEYLGREPGALLHHVRKLHRTGFLELAEQRPGPRGTVEKPYRATGKSWTLDVGDTEQAVSFAALEAFREETREAGAARQVMMSRLTLRLSEDRAGELSQRLQDLIAEYHATQDPDGNAYGAFLAIHLSPDDP